MLQNSNSNPKKYPSQSLSSHRDSLLKSLRKDDSEAYKHVKRQQLRNQIHPTSELPAISQHLSRNLQVMETQGEIQGFGVGRLAEVRQHVISQICRFVERNMWEGGFRRQLLAGKIMPAMRANIIALKCHHRRGHGHRRESEEGSRCRAAIHATKYAYVCMTNYLFEYAEGERDLYFGLEGVVELCMAGIRDAGVLRACRKSISAYGRRQGERTEARQKIILVLGEEIFNRYRLDSPDRWNQTKSCVYCSEQVEGELMRQCVQFGRWLLMEYFTVEWCGQEISKNEGLLGLVAGMLEHVSHKAIVQMTIETGEDDIEGESDHNKISEGATQTEQDIYCYSGLSLQEESVCETLLYLRDLRLATDTLSYCEVIPVPILLTLKKILYSIADALGGLTSQQATKSQIGTSSQPERIRCLIVDVIRILHQQLQIDEQDEQELVGVCREIGRLITSVRMSDCL